MVATAIKVHSVLQNKDKIRHGDLSGLSFEGLMVALSEGHGIVMSTCYGSSCSSPCVLRIPSSSQHFNHFS